MDNLSKLPEMLQELLFDRGIKAPKLAEDLGIGKNTITRYLQGTSSPQYSILIKLIEYFHCSSDFLLGVTEQPLYDATFLPVRPFAEQFRKAIYECKTTQYALQQKMGVSWNSFHKWLKGKALPDCDSLIKIALSLECSIDFLLGRVN